MGLRMAFLLMGVRLATFFAKKFLRHPEDLRRPVVLVKCFERALPDDAWIVLTVFGSHVSEKWLANRGVAYYAGTALTNIDFLNISTFAYAFLRISTFPYAFLTCLRVLMSF